MIDPHHPIAELLRHDKRYHFEAYLFVFQALRFAQSELGMGVAKELEEDEGEGEVQRHVTGQELCRAMRQFAHREYGYLARLVLNHWGVSSTGDFGEIVFNLIEIGQMRKTPEDRREDFDDVYDFDDAFQHSFQFKASDVGRDAGPGSAEDE